MIFVDTSILVAATITTHPNHNACGRLIDANRVTGIACSTHALAETYAMLSTFPTPRRMKPKEAVEVIESLRGFIKIVPMSVKDYLQVLHAAASLGLSGPIIYDAMHMACARKIGAKLVFTLNTKHFRAVAPDLALQIHEP